MATRVGVEAGAETVPMPTVRQVGEPIAAPAALAVPRIDMYLLSTVVCLLVIGTVFIYSASMYQSYAGIGDPGTQGNVNYYLIRQISWLMLGTIALVVGTQFDFRQLRKYSMLGIGITTGLLLLIHVPQFSHTANGATRWVQFHGISIQPSEIGKLALTIYAAHWLSSKKDDVRHSIKGLIPFGTVLGFTTLLIFQQPDLGTAAVVSAAMLGDVLCLRGPRPPPGVSWLPSSFPWPTSSLIKAATGRRESTSGATHSPINRRRATRFPAPCWPSGMEVLPGSAWATGNSRIPFPPRKPILFSPQSARKPG